MRELRERNLPALYVDEDEWIRLRCRLIEEAEEEEEEALPVFRTFARPEEKKRSFWKHLLLQTAVSAALVLTLFGLRSWMPEVCGEVQDVLSQDFSPEVEEGIEEVIAGFHG